MFRYCVQISLQDACSFPDSTQSSEASSSNSSIGSAATGPETLCQLCLTRNRCAALVHGRTAHMVSCYPCAKKLENRRKPCPVCRRTISKVIKIFFSWPCVAMVMCFSSVCLLDFAALKLVPAFLIVLQVVFFFILKKFRSSEWSQVWNLDTGISLVSNALINRNHVSTFVQVAELKE